ncbi:uncharacterized protein BYT42DRAFT_583149 [Radiomyces spectabilis]|uniref:uncharacterized protein n=1 Tax=Radiomyces spectabilis TaxID=64574 RepID=UPI00221EBB56|nr:uncharacterized protein BYT42DRAFT_583149 [Radiomyces spectabilis]KAI8370641.1 hypothetical protein BYT42DRAFT_583149 [Radiomyces spectabilis]
MSTSAEIPDSSKQSHLPSPTRASALSTVRDSEPDDAEESTDDENRHHEFVPPFLVRTKSRQEKASMREQFQRQHESKSPYDALYRYYTRFSTSAMLENKASVARDHLANERTFLAWLRTSLSLITVGVAITQLYHLAPTTGNSHAQTGKALGATFVVFSIIFLYFANARYFHSQVAMTKGQFPASRGAVILGSTCVLGVLIAMFVVTIVQQ